MPRCTPSDGDDLPRSAAKRRTQRAPTPETTKRPSAKKIHREDKPATYSPIDKGEEAMGDLELLLIAKQMGWLPKVQEAVRQARMKGGTMAATSKRLGVSLQLMQVWNRTPAAAREQFE